MDSRLAAFIADFIPEATTIDNYFGSGTFGKTTSGIVVKEIRPVMEVLYNHAIEISELITENKLPSNVHHMNVSPYGIGVILY